MSKVMILTFKTTCNMYGHTDVVVDDNSLVTGYAQCGNGDSYKLSLREKNQLRDIIAGKLDKEEFEQDRPVLIRITQQQAIQAMLDHKNVYLSREERKKWRDGCRSIFVGSSWSTSGYSYVGMRKNRSCDYYGEKHSFNIVELNNNGNFTLVSSYNSKECGDMCNYKQLRFKL